MGIQIQPVRLGALPILHVVAKKLGLIELLRKHVPTDPRDKMPVSQTLYIVLCNVILERFPLYKIGEWAGQRQLSPPIRDVDLGDDRVGRALHRLFRSDRATLITEVVLQAIKGFDLECDRVHNDSTTVSLFGQYDLLHKAAKPKRGHNKDHRPDLKQLLFSLSVIGDGAVPVYFKVWDGNITDDQTHLRNWMSLRGLLGRPDFIYVADSKLCVRDVMTFIDSEGGTFLTVLPETRGEDKKFKDWIQTQTPSWHEVMRRKGKTKGDPDSIWWAFESPYLTSEGFRILWIRSSDKARLDEEKRTARIDKSAEAMTHLQDQPHRSRERLESSLREILKENNSDRYFHWQITRTVQEQFKQAHRGRPKPDSQYRKVEKVLYHFTWSHNQEAIRYDARCDGLFPLITNDRKSSASEILSIYKYQPQLEKRHEQLKSVYNVAPVFLKHPERIEALLFVYFLGLLMTALLERSIRKAMEDRNIESIPIYPERRACQKPTADKILDLFRDIRRQAVLQDGKRLGTINDDLTKIQLQVLDLLKIKPEEFFMARPE